MIGLNRTTPKKFQLGSPPLVVLQNGGGDESFGIRPLQFFDYSDTEWGLLYLAQQGSSNLTRTIKLATANKSGFDHTWIKQGQVLDKGSGSDWDRGIGGGNVVRYGEQWILIYDGFEEGMLGIATGTDLLSMTKSVNNPVIDNTANITDFNRYSRHPNILIHNGLLYCVYEGRNQDPRLIINSKPAYATAPLNDIENWTINPNPLFYGEDIEYADGESKAICNFNINKIEGYYYMWYQAYAPQDNADDYEFGGTSYAYSRNLVNWNFVGTKNYHIPMSLFGYSSSNEFYQTCQENTPAYVNGEMSIYMWDLTTSFIGRVPLDNGKFINEFRGFELEDDFNDDSVDTNKWTVGSGTGITVSETGGKLQIVADGVGSESSFPTLLTSNVSLNNDDCGAIHCVFDLTVSDVDSDYFSVELSDATRDNRIALSRNLTSGILFEIYESGSQTQSVTVPFTGSSIFKFTISGRNRCELYIGDIFFNFIQRYQVASFQNIDWFFKIVMNNNAGQTLTLDNFALGKYDQPKVKDF